MNISLKKCIVTLMSVLIPFSGVLCSCKSFTNSSESSNNNNSGGATKEIVCICPTPYPSDPAESSVQASYCGEEDILNKLDEMIKSRGYDFKVTFKEYPMENYLEKIKELKASGEQADLISSGGKMLTIDSVGTSVYHNFINEGIFTDLTSYFDSEKGRKIKSCVSAVLLNNTYTDGKLYAITPENQKASIPANLVNEDIQKKYNISDDELKKYDTDLEPILEKVAEGEKNNDYIMACGGFYRCNYLWKYHDILCSCVGVPYDSEEAKAENIFDNKNIIKELNFINDCKIKGYKKETVQDEAGNRTSVFLYTTALCDNKVDYEFKESQDSGKTMNYKAIPIQETYTYIKNSSVQGNVYGIASWSENKDETFDLMYLFNTDKEIVDLLTYGIEGTDYNKEDNFIVKTQSGTNREMYYSERLLNSLIASQLKPNENYAINQLQLDTETRKKANDEAKASPIIGFYFDRTPVQQEIDATNAVMTKYDEIWNKQYNTKDFDKDFDLDKSIQDIKSELDKAGIQKIVDEANKQIDEWKKTKN